MHSLTIALAIATFGGVLLYVFFSLIAQVFDRLDNMNVQIVFENLAERSAKVAAFIGCLVTVVMAVVTIIENITR
jgi:hypothetical protein